MKRSFLLAATATGAALAASAPLASASEPAAPVVACSPSGNSIQVTFAYPRFEAGQVSTETVSVGGVQVHQEPYLLRATHTLDFPTPVGDHAVTASVLVTYGRYRGLRSTSTVLKACGVVTIPPPPVPPKEPPVVVPPPSPAPVPPLPELVPDRTPPSVSVPPRPDKPPRKTVRRANCGSIPAKAGIGWFNGSRLGYRCPLPPRLQVPARRTPAVTG